MTRFLENLFAAGWNRLQRRPEGIRHGLDLGQVMEDGEVTNRRLRFSSPDRDKHTACFGLSGYGKTRLIDYEASQDLEQGAGFASLDFHADSFPRLLGCFAAYERRYEVDLSPRLIIIDPTDVLASIGLNSLACADRERAFIHVAEVAEILKDRLGLKEFGPRTGELLLYTLYTLSVAGYTLVDIRLFLTNPQFRAFVLARINHPEVTAYFQERFDRASEAMRAVVADAVLNKVTPLAADPQFRHILGQQRSTLNVREALDQGRWILFNLPKGVLGEHATTLASLFFTHLKSALFARRSRTPYGLYLDEVQNLVSSFSDLDTLISESRKFGIRIHTANQHLEQLPPPVRAALLSCSNFICFRLAHADAERMAGALDGGKNLAELLRNLPPREIVAKRGHDRWIRAKVPFVRLPAADYSDLYRRCRARWATPRIEVERLIRERQAGFGQTARGEALHDWQ
jgi:hypothetical protein